MAIEIKRREGETINSVMYRFNKRVQQSGVFKEARKRQFTKRGANRGRRKLAALYRLDKQDKLSRSRKYGYKSA